MSPIPCATSKGNKNAVSKRIKLIILGAKGVALLSPEATHPFVSPQLVDNLGLCVKRKESFWMLIAKGQKVLLEIVSKQM